MPFVRFITLLIVIIGALNWGAWGIVQYDFIADIFGANSSIWARICYAIIGIAGLYGIRFLFIGANYRCKKCSSNSPSSKGQRVSRDIEEEEEDEDNEE